ncbi:hypothetical protein AMS68_000836 [Peltaster fructicola]|uniref:Uncharacterized protein n=1 Tax=Peltaster fructicola TaxID=286661 RepID=A0A6H0XL16_9PEZI|nr:hypothetical protein AMS68_000836 [Peltaster fructicola]
MGNVQSSVPYGAQINAINAAVFNGPQSCNTYVTLTAPISGGSAQQVSFTDLTGQFELPAFFAAQADQVFGSTQFEANATINCDITNALPSSFSISTSVQQKWPNDLIKFQADGSVLAPIGPVRLGDAGQSAATQNVEYILASVDINNSEGDPIAPANGVPGTFPATPLGSKSVVANVPLSCTEDIFTDNPNTKYRFTIGATSPVALTSGQSFKLSRINSYLTIPGDRVNTFTTFPGDGGAADLDRTIFVNTLNTDGNPNIGIALDNASPASIDLARQFVPSDSSTSRPLDSGGEVNGVSSDPLIVSLPYKGYLNITSITAGQSGQMFSVNVQDFNALLQTYNSRFVLLGQDNLKCVLNSTTSFLRAPITA